MKILLLSFYYPPDLCAGSFRAAALVDALLETGGASVTVDVMTTRPNRYASFVSQAAAVETAPGLTIHRFQLPSHEGGAGQQAWSYLAYANAVRVAIKSGTWDVVVATSSRLMTAVLGAQVAKRVQARLYLDIRDLFTDTASDVFQGLAARIALPALHWLERRTLRAADRINAVSPAFVPYLKQRAPQQTYRVFANGIDEGFLSHDFAKPDRAPSSPRLIVYAGNMGEGQGLHCVLPKAAALLGPETRFRLIGDGAKKSLLQSRLAATGVTNVTLLPPLPREQLYEHYREADALFLHLNDHPAFRKVLPSKIFEYAATGKPIIAGASGLAAAFLENEVGGVALFAPCDPAGMARAVASLDEMPSRMDRSVFRARYARRDIMMRMAKDILALGETG